MKFLKGLALSLLNLLLFLSLSSLGLVFMLNNTILTPDFLISEVDKVDMPSLAQELLSKQIPQDEPYMADVLENTFTDLEDWIKEQVNAAIYTSYDYFLGKSDSLSLVIPLEPVREGMKENLRQAILESPPPEFEAASPAEKELILNEAGKQITADIPANFEFTESSLPPDVLATLGQVRQGIGYLQLGYKALIGFILLLVLGIILINRQVKSATRGIGTTVLTLGILEYLSILMGKYFAEAMVVQPSIPLQFQTLLPQILSDILAPLEMFCIGLAVVGVALLIISFVYKPRQPSS